MRNAPAKVRTGGGNTLCASPIASIGRDSRKNSVSVALKISVTCSSKLIGAAIDDFSAGFVGVGVITLVAGVPLP